MSNENGANTPKENTKKKAAPKKKEFVAVCMINPVTEALEVAAYGYKNKEDITKKLADTYTNGILVEYDKPKKDSK